MGHLHKCLCILLHVVVFQSHQHLCGEESGVSQRLKISGIQGLTQVNDHSARVVVFEVRDGLCEQRDDLPLVGGREGREEAKRACSDFLPFTLSSPPSLSLLPSVPH